MWAFFIGFKSFPNEWKKSETTPLANYKLVIKMTTWHRAKIKFQYSPKGIPSHRVMNSVTTQVYGNTESAALQALRKMYPSWQDFVILELDWQ